MATAVAPQAFDRVESPPPLLVAMATLSAAAAVIHFVMVPSHMDEFAAEGIAFAVAGWLQLLAAFWLWTQPTRPLLAFTVVTNAAFVGAWAWSRTAGLPVGPEAGVAEEVSVVDLTAVGLEVALILLAVSVLVRPKLAEITLPPGLGMALPLAVVAITSTVLASPEARSHGHSEEAMPGAVAADGHGHGGEAAAGSEEMVNDQGLSLLTNGHHHEIRELPMSPQTTQELKAQLAVTQRVAERFPTVASAEAAGYRRAGPYSPGLGAHYTRPNAPALNFDGVMDPADLRNPMAIIYDGTEPTSEVAGFMYYASTSTEPEGFVGDNDVWHYHENTCIRMANGEIDSPFGADLEVTQAQCADAGGFLIGQTQYMVHVWSVPGWNNVDGGAFAEVNPALACEDGSYWRLPSSEWAAHPLNVCEAGAA